MVVNRIVPDPPTAVALRKAEELFLEIVQFSHGRFDTDRATYHISGRLDQVPAQPLSEEWERAYLDEDAGRQILHVTYGSVLTQGVALDGSTFHARIMAVLEENDGLHCELVARHLGRHIERLEASPT